MYKFFSAIFLCGYLNFKTIAEIARTYIIKSCNLDAAAVVVNRVQIQY